MTNIVVKPINSETASVSIQQSEATVIKVSEGFIGETGRAATVTVGTVTTGAAGSAASITNSGTLYDAVFDFIIPKGDKGDQGDAATLDVGTVTVVNPDQDPSVTNSGTTSDAIFDFSLPSAATLDLGTVSVVNPNVNPSVTDVGTNGNVVLDIDLPRAADLTLGTITVVTPDTNPSITDVGTNGDAQFNFSLPRAATIGVNTTTVLNPDQNPSVADTGTAGDAAFTFSLPRAPTFTVGTVTTGAEGSSATVTDVGTNGDITLDFSIPVGDTGETGDPGVIISATAPANTEVIWADTSEPGENVLPNGGTTDQYLVKVSDSDFDTAWETLTGSRVSYDNTNSDLTATLVQTAIDELDAKKLNISALTSSVKFFATTAAGAVGGYARLVTDTGDADYDDPAVAVTVGPFTGTGQLLGSLVSDAGVLDGNTTPINITTIGNVRRSSGNTNDVANFYFEVYKRDSGGTETLIGTSSTTASVTIDTFEEFFADCLIQDTLFTATDRVVLKFYGNVLAGGGGETYEFQYGGNQPVRTLFPVPVTVVPDVKTASDIQVDASGFSGLLSGTDDDVQTALNTLDGVTKSDIGLGDVPNLDTTDAVNKAHDQNTDTKLAEGTADEVTATTLAELANAERRDAFYDTILRPSGIDIPPDVLHWPSPYRPTLNLDATVARAGAGTIYNNRGLIESVGANLLRRDYEPDTGRFRGALAEPQRTNLLSYSEQFDNAAWTKNNVTVEANAIVATDGTLTMDKLIEDTSTGNHQLNWGLFSITLTTNVPQSFSIYAKKGELSEFQIRWGVWRNFCIFDLQTQTATPLVNATYVITNEKIEDVGNGIYRCSFTMTNTGNTATAQLSVRLRKNGTDSYTGDGTSGIYIWGAQLEAGAYPSSYIKTEATSVTRPADTLTIPQVGDRRRGFICWEGVPQIDPNVAGGLTTQVRQFPFGRENAFQSIEFVAFDTFAARFPNSTNRVFLSHSNSSNNKLCRFAYWWDIDSGIVGLSNDGFSNTAATTDSVPTDLPIRFGQTNSQADVSASSHTNWIYISYNIPSIAEIEALTGAVV